MHVIATAGHVDHGKSTLVRALTGMEPDRLAEERDRGLTIDLGFAWTRLPGGERLAFVDVPGHERLVGTMLAGVGPAPAVLFVVAADQGWQPQSTEHLAVLDALGVRHGLLVITRCDLADLTDPAVTTATTPATATAAGTTGITAATGAVAVTGSVAAVREDALARIAATSLGTVEAVTVSAVTGAGLDALRAALTRLTGALPAPDPVADVRLWVDRAFTVRGRGTVVTGTLGAGTVRVGDRLALTGDGATLRVRGLQTLKRDRTEVSAVARVAVNLHGADAGRLRRGDALLTPRRWLGTGLIDVRLTGDPAAELPRRLTLHLGSAAVPVTVRPLGDDTARLTLSNPLPIRIGDSALLRDPGRHRVAAGVTVLDVRPPPLARRGAAAERARELREMTGVPDGAAELRRRGLLRRTDLLAMGVPLPDTPAGAVPLVTAGDWLADRAHWAALRQRLVRAVERHATEHPLDPGLPTDAARRALDLPEAAGRELVTALAGHAAEPPLEQRAGRLYGRRTRPTLPPRARAAVDAVRRELARTPFRAPEAGRLAELGLTYELLAAAAAAGALLRLADGIVLLPGDDARAAAVLARLGRPFAPGEARRALDSTRRVTVPLLEHLDRQGYTTRLDGTRRTCRPPRV